MGSILVLGELSSGQPNDTTLELLCEARAIADKGSLDVCAVLVGEMADDASAKIISYGADKVLAWCGDSTTAPDTEDLLTAMKHAANEVRPRLVLVSATIEGAAIAPRLAVALGAAYIPNTISVELQDNGVLKATHAVCQAKAQEAIEHKSTGTTVIAFKPSSLGAGNSNPKRKGEIEQLNCSPAQKRTVVNRFIEADPETVQLDEALRVVAVGDAVRDEPAIDQVHELGSLLSAALGGSKPVVDKGWLPRKRLIGQSSGRKVAADIFVAVGLSGSSYFLEGMKDSKTIVALNRDAGAPIMKQADVAAVGDMREIVPRVIDILRERRQEQEG